MKRILGQAVEHDEAMPIRAVKTAPPDWVVGGFVAAVERVEQAASDLTSARAISIPLAEALMWLDVLRQTDRDVGRGHEMAAELARDPLIKALTFVRGRVHHHWAPAVDPDHESGRWVWVRADNLPLPPGKPHLNSSGEKLYRELLEGEPVLEALNEVVTRLKALI